jgi:hypothetical protein
MGHLLGSTFVAPEFSSLRTAFSTTNRRRDEIILAKLELVAARAAQRALRAIHDELQIERVRRRKTRQVQFQKKESEICSTATTREPAVRNSRRGE